MKKSEVIKVSKKVMPVPFDKREKVELIIGNDYYVSFGCHEVEKCTLVSINHNEMISIRTADAGYEIFPDEIGLTPEQAVMNHVTQ